jgi:hypothetical protein
MRRTMKEEVLFFYLDIVFFKAKEYLGCIKRQEWDLILFLFFPLDIHLSLALKC